MRLRTMAAWALALTLFQLALFMGLSGGSTLSERYLSAHQWDSVWYQDIADRGYVSTIPPEPRGEVSNVTHFPAYPIFIRGTYELGRALKGDFDFKTASLLSAQAFSFMFWWILLVALQGLGSTPAERNLCVLLVLTHPAAFFFITAYSEPLFCAAFVGFLLFCARWADTRNARDWWLAAGFGLVGSATRVTGVLLPLVPLGAWVWSGYDRKRLPQLLGLSVLASMGTMLFFIYCHFKFGIWNLYQIRQQLGWGHRTDYLAILKWRTYRVQHFRGWLEYFTVGQLLRLPIMGFLAAGLWLTRKDGKRMAYVLGAIVFLYIGISSLSYTGGISAWVRYFLPIWIGLALGTSRFWVESWKSAAPGSARKYSLLLLGVLISLGGLCFQLKFQHIFSVGGYVE